MLIEQLNPIIEHIAGSDNKVTDAVSRPLQVKAMHLRQCEEDSTYTRIYDSVPSYEFTDNKKNHRN